MKHVRRTATMTAIFLCIGSSVAASAPTRDGAIVVNSGSTNSAPYEIKMWSDGSAALILNGGEPSTLHVDPAAVKAYFAAVADARANPGTASHCMKSASFGTTVTTTWHEWSSPDLTCPPFSAPVAKLASIVQGIVADARITTMPRRLHLPPDMRRAPMSPAPSPPEASPTAPAESPSP